MVKKDHEVRVPTQAETPWRFWYHETLPLADSVQAALDWHLLRHGVAANELLCHGAEYQATAAVTPPGVRARGTMALLKRHIMARYNPELDADG